MRMTCFMIALFALSFTCRSAFAFPSLIFFFSFLNRNAIAHLAVHNYRYKEKPHSGSCKWAIKQTFYTQKFCRPAELMCIRHAPSVCGRITWTSVCLKQAGSCQLGGAGGKGVAALRQSLMKIWLIWLIGRVSLIINNLQHIIGAIEPMPKGDTHTRTLRPSSNPRITPASHTAWQMAFLVARRAAELGLNIFVITFPRRVINFVSLWFGPRLEPCHALWRCRWHLPLCVACFCALFAVVKCHKTLASHSD